MSLYKGPNGVWEADIRVVGVGRWHGSMGTRKRSEAQPRYDAVRRLFREAKGPSGADRRSLIEQLRDGSLSIERLESMVAHGEALVPAEPSIESDAAWPILDEAIEQYLSWLTLNPKKSESTHNAARAGLRRFANFEMDGVRTGLLPVDRIPSARVEAYQMDLIQKPTPANTVTAYVARIATLWYWLQKRERRASIEQRRAAAPLHSPLDPEIQSKETTRRDRWLTKAEARALVGATPPRLRLPVMAGLFGGFRLGEILHMRTYGDVDLTLGTLSVAAKQIGVRPDGQAVYWRPKTRRSARVVPIGPDLLPVLEEHIIEFASDQWLMPTLDDAATPFRKGTFERHFETVVINAGLVYGRKDPRGVTFHTLRHTFASWLVMSGVDLYTVAHLLGDSLQMVEDTYAHLAPDYKRRAIEALRGALTAPEPGEKPRELPQRGQKTDA